MELRDLVKAGGSRITTSNSVSYTHLDVYKRQEFRVIVPKNSIYPQEKIDLNILDRKKEIDLSSSWGRDFIRWHEEIFGAESMADISINAVPTIPKYLTEEEQWAIVPVSVAEELIRTNQVHACLLYTSLYLPLGCKAN